LSALNRAVSSSLSSTTEPGPRNCPTSS